MLLDRLFKPRPSREAGRALYARVVEQSRTPAFYREMGAPDTVEGRFELYSLHVMLLLDRFKREGAEAAETAQALFDTYLSALDHALREMGVGDLSVGKKMRKLGEAFFGRVKSYQEAFEALPATAGLEALLARTVYAEAADARPAGMAAYVAAQRAALAAQPLEALRAGHVDWKSL